MDQEDRRRLPVSFLFQVYHDPGHQGPLDKWRLERTGKKYIVRYSPPWDPGQKPLRPPETLRPLTAEERKSLDSHQEKTEERNADEAERFLHTLVRDIQIGELKNLKTQAWLHPTIYTFEMKYTDGGVHRIEYMIEGDHHLDERYIRLVNECRKFFQVK